MKIKDVLENLKNNDDMFIYDKVSILSYAMKTMSTLPKEDFYTIMESITITSGNNSVA